MRIKLLLLISISILLTKVNTAQESNSEKMLVFLVPQYMLTNGIRIDLEMHKAESAKWWIISAYYYSDSRSFSLFNSNRDYEPYDYDKMSGIGLGISRKIYISKHLNKGFYAMPGISFKYFNINGDKLTFIETIGEDGLTYNQMQDLDYTVNINSFDAFISMGHQFNFISRFYLDFNIGVGFKYSTHQSPEKVTLEYNRGIIDYGYTGVHLIGCMRLGVFLF